MDTRKKPDEVLKDLPLSDSSSVNSVPTQPERDGRLACWGL